MASYTMQLREFIEQATQDDETLSSKQRIEIGRSKLFDFDYPIFDENYRNVFETNFIRNFYMREIGFETEGLFKFQLETWLNINMPYYNKLFESENLTYDVLTDYKVEVKHDKTGDISQSDDVTKQQKETNSVIVSESDNVIETANVNKTNNVTINNTSNKNVNEISEVDGQTTSDTETTKENSSKSSTDDTDKQNTFTRELLSDMPDSRLSIVVNQGQSVIEYASKIEEDMGTVTNEKMVDVTSEGNENTSGSSTEKVKSENITNLTDKTTDTGSQTDVGQENANKSIEVSKNNNVSESKSLTNNDDLKRNINTVENYIEFKTGKVGGSSYAKLVMEYRESLLRIERQIFNEMNELFMLVY